MNKGRVKKIIKDGYPYVIVIIVVILIRSFIVTPAVVDGVSMEPTLKDNNIVILNKFNYKIKEIKRFDVVVVNWNNEKLIKRVVALPGEHVMYKEGILYIDGAIEIESFKHKTTDDFNIEQIGYLTIPGDKYFVVGDNRSNSIDSRFIGLIDKKDIEGKVNLRIFPLNKINVVR